MARAATAAAVLASRLRPCAVPVAGAAARAASTAAIHHGRGTRVTAAAAASGRIDGASAAGLWGAAPLATPAAPRSTLLHRAFSGAPRDSEGGGGHGSAPRGAGLPPRPPTADELRDVGSSDEPRTATTGGGEGGGNAPAGGTAQGGAPLVEHTLSVDRSGLLGTQHAHPHGGDSDVPGVDRTAAAPPKTADTPLLSELRTHITMRGPLSVAEFMRQALGHPAHGYYTQGDVFGKDGDFTTSPEISQLFGEMLGVWCVSTWAQMGHPDKFHLVEIGPGRGTLMSDLLRTARRFPAFYDAVAAVHMVEMSDALRGVQARTLGCDGAPPMPPAGPATGRVVDGNEVSLPSLEALSLDDGKPVRWHTHVVSVPDDAPVLLVAQELFDALPVHQFQMTPSGWRERLVDVDDDPYGPHHLRLVLSPGVTPTLSAFLMALQRGAVPRGAVADAGSVTKAAGADAGSERTASASTDSGASTPASSTSSGSSDSDSAAPGASASGGDKDDDAEGDAVFEAALEALDALDDRDLQALAEELARSAARPTAPDAPAMPIDAGTPAASAAQGPTSVSVSGEGTAGAPVSTVTAAAAPLAVGMESAQPGDCVEISPASTALAYEIAELVAMRGGAAVFIDYGRDGMLDDSLRGIKRHKFVDVLLEPGRVDLSADVDFAALRRAVSTASGAACHGPVTQSEFLQRLGIAARVEALVEATGDDEEAAERLIGEATRLLHPDQMGSVYKVMAVTGAGVQDAPVGFGGDAGEL